MYTDVEGRVSVEGESKGTLMGVPKVHRSQRQGNPEPHSINLMASSLTWPGSKKRRTWVKTASGCGYFSPSHLWNAPFWCQEQKVNTEKTELKLRPRIGGNWSRKRLLINLLKDTPSAQEWSLSQTLVYILTTQELPASSGPHLFHVNFSPPHLCQESAG